MYVMTLNYLRTVYIYIYSCVANKVRQKKTSVSDYTAFPNRPHVGGRFLISYFFYSGVTWPPALQIMVGKEFFLQFHF